MEQKKIANMQLNHLGIILSNISLAGLIFVLGIVSFYIFYAVFTAIVTLILIIPVLVTFGLILFSKPDYFAWLDTGSGVVDFVSKILPAIPYVAGVTAVLAVLSIVCLSMYKGQKSVWRIVVSSIVVVLSIAVMICILGGVFN
jgi:hypothetical protein